MSTSALKASPESPPASPGRPRRPVLVTVSAGLQLAVGSLTSIAGTAFATAAGGGWYVGTALFPIALVLWWTSGVGLLRGSTRGFRLGIGMLVALFGFDLLKILYYHEGAGYVFCALTIVGLALQLNPVVRAWVRRSAR